jgi:hypothetical protein
MTTDERNKGIKTGSIAVLIRPTACSMDFMSFVSSVFASGC